MDKEHLIIDGDWGGDEMQLLAVALAHPERCDVLGLTSTFGNTKGEYTFANGRNIVNFLGAPNIPVYRGADEPTVPGILAYDGAHGEDGIGGATLNPSPAPVEKKSAVKFILDQLQNARANTITITASGPLTNIAECIEEAPDIMKKVKRIVIMGGCTEEMPAADMPVRRGNISPHSEFNFLAAPHDAKTVMESGLPITLLPMNCTHQLTLTPNRAAEIKLALMAHSKAASTALQMMSAPRELDRKKFDIDPVMHDVHCTLAVLFPEHYPTAKGNVNVTLPADTAEDKNCFTSHAGHTDFTEHAKGNVTVATGVDAPDKLFTVVKQSLQKCLSQKREHGMAR